MLSMVYLTESSPLQVDNKMEKCATSNEVNGHIINMFSFLLDFYLSFLKALQD